MILPSASQPSPNNPSAESENPASSEEEDTYYYIPLTKIAGHPPERVEKYLGKPLSHATVNPSLAGCPCDQYTYWNGNVDVMYLHDAADWITVRHLNTHTFTPGEALSALGIPTLLRPDISNDTLMEWKGVNGYQSIQVFRDSHRGIDHAFIRIHTLQ